MESTPRPGYYPDPSVPGYIRYWDGSKWVPGTSKPMPKKAGGGADADVLVESGAVPPPPRSAAGAGEAMSQAASSGGSSNGSRTAGSGELPAFDPVLPLPQEASQSTPSFQDADDSDPVSAPLAKAPSPRRARWPR